MNASTYADADSQFAQIYNFKFVLGHTVWNLVLERLQIVNMTLQKKNISVDDIGGFLSWLKEFKDGYEKCFTQAKEKSELLGLDTSSGFDYKKRGEDGLPDLLNETQHHYSQTRQNSRPNFLKK